MVRSGKIFTAAGVSAGIDLALWLAGEIAGRARAEATQLVIEYDPQPPFNTGHMSKASKETQQLAKEMMDHSFCWRHKLVCLSAPSSLGLASG
jgi:transcriptional regulator GlxA family with amidase domain